MKTITLAALVESAGNIPEPLIRATVRQIGGWRTFKEIAENVTNHGAAGGFRGFTYYADTLGFTRRNRADIVTLCETMADDLGESGPVALVKGFQCLQGSTESEIARTLYGKGGEDTQVGNALAWFALEEVCRAYVDLSEINA
jgi:hypothetical protein